MQSSPWRSTLRRWCSRTMRSNGGGIFAGTQTVWKVSFAKYRIKRRFRADARDKRLPVRRTTAAAITMPYPGRLYETRIYSVTRTREICDLTLNEFALPKNYDILFNNMKMKTISDEKFSLMVRLKFALSLLWEREKETDGFEMFQLSEFLCCT